MWGQCNIYIKIRKNRRFGVHRMEVIYRLHDFTSTHLFLSIVLHATYFWHMFQNLHYFKTKVPIIAMRFHSILWISSIFAMLCYQARFWVVFAQFDHLHFALLIDYYQIKELPPKNHYLWEQLNQDNSWSSGIIIHQN